jgi:tetratricopeptide (TPR) repeat protein
MADLVIEFLERLEQTKGDPHAQSAVAAEFALAARPEAEREPLRAALDAAALLHWFDARLLHKVLGIPEEEAANRFKALKDMPFVEQYRRGEHDLRNVHESTRLGWRKQLAHADGPRFRLLSKQASDCFAADLAPAAQIERIYHLLCADPEAGASGLETLNRQWSSSAYPEDRYALAAVLKELEDSQLLAGRARAWALLVIAWARDTRGETAQLQEVATAALLLARQTKDQSAEGDAQALLGDVLQVQGKLEEAQVAFGEYLAISRRLAAQDPSNACWQRELAVAHSKVGGMFEAQGKLALALAAFREFLAILGRVAAQDPSNAGWQRELAVAHSKVGGVLQAQGKLTEAQAELEARMQINSRLVELDKSNAAWQHGLAVAHNLLGDALQAQGKLAEAQAAFEESLVIIHRLAAQDSNNAGWQRDLAVGHSRVGDVLEAKGKLGEAQAAFGECLTISRRLVAQGPGNVGWQRELAVACIQLARFESKAGRHAAALPHYKEASRIFGELAVKAPRFALWAKEKEQAEAELAKCRLLVRASKSPGSSASEGPSGSQKP